MFITPNEYENSVDSNNDSPAALYLMQDGEQKGLSTVRPHLSGEIKEAKLELFAPATTSAVIAIMSFSFEAHVRSHSAPSQNIRA
jgi:hypothetical protein